MSKTSEQRKWTRSCSCLKFETWRTTLQEAEIVYVKMPPGTGTGIETARKEARKITSEEAESRMQAQSVKTPVHYHHLPHLSLLSLLPHPT